MSDKDIKLIISFGDRKVETTQEDLAKVAKDLKAGKLKYNHKTKKWERIKERPKNYQGYQPKFGNLDVNNPPKGGSGVTEKKESK